VITRPAYDPTEAIAVMRGDLSGCVVAIDDLHASPAADALLRALFEVPGTTKILVATRTQPTFYERSDLVAGRVLEVPLQGLDDRASGELLRARGAMIEGDAIQHVIAATHGHPLALELFAASGLDAGAVETERYVLETVLDGLDDSSRSCCGSSRSSDGQPGPQRLSGRPCPAPSTRPPGLAPSPGRRLPDP